MKVEGSRIDAETLAARFWSIIKHMPQMASTSATRNLNPSHEKTSLLFHLHTPPRHRRPKARPACSRVIFRRRGKEGLPTSSTPIHTSLFIIRVDAGKSWLCPFFPKDVVLCSRQLLLPCFIRKVLHHCPQKSLTRETAPRS